FSAAKSTRALYSDALSSSTQSGLHALAHCATERDSASKLFSNPLCDELSFNLSVLHFEDVELDLLASEFLKLAANTVCFGTTTADDDTRTRSVNVDADSVTSAFDFHLGDTGTLET